MPRTKLPAKAQESLRNLLEGLDGVHRVLIEGAPDRAILVCEPAARPDVETEVRAALEREGIAPDSLELLFSYIARGDLQRRVRFQGTAVERATANVSIARTVLEWHGRRHEGRAEGEGGPHLDLRICAQATIEALQQIVGAEVTFQLVGIKAIRIFDHDLVAVVLHSPQAADRRLIGSSLVLDDLHRSAGMAVLNATNRLLGNYLVAD